MVRKSTHITMTRNSVERKDHIPGVLRFVN